MRLSKIKSAQGAIERGSWVSSALFPGVKHLVKGASCVAARAMRDRLVTAIPRDERANGLSQEQLVEIENAVLVDVLWLNSSGLTDDDDKPIQLTDEKKRELIEDADFAMLRDDIVSAAARCGDAELANTETDAKN